MQRNIIIITMLFVALVSVSGLQAQQNITISGFVYDKTTGEILPGAFLYASGSKVATVTNSYGFFSISLKSNNKTQYLKGNFIGYKPDSVLISGINPEITHHFYLESGVDIQEVEVQSNRMEQVDEINAIKLSLEQVKTLPAFVGEKDILKAFQLMPGVHGGAEGTSNLFVRGGTPDQNLILLDDVPLYHINHLGGFFSVFDENAISNIDLIKGGFPARYGGKLSSVLDVRMKDGNMYNYKGSFSLGLIATKASYEGPIRKQKSSFFVSARRCNLDLLSNALLYFGNAPVATGYTFYDLNFKINTKLSDKNRLYFSLYYGNDIIWFKLRDIESSKDFSDNTFKYNWKNNWGNFVSALRFNRTINAKLFGNLSVSVLNYRFQYGHHQKLVDENDAIVFQNDIEYSTGIQDVHAKAYFDYYANNNVQLKFGASSTYHVFQPGELLYYKQLEDSVIENRNAQAEIYASENYVFLENRIKIKDKLTLNIGVHASLYGKSKTFFYSAQPRLNANYFVGQNTTLNLSFNTMKQYLHLLSNSSVGMAYDMWLPSTENIKPEYAKQISAGINHQFPNNKYSVIASGYYKQLSDLIDFKEGASFIDVFADWQNRLETNGTGTAYGAELLLRKNSGRLNGWLAYTYSRSFRQFTVLNLGKEFPFRYDRPHNLSAVASYKLSEKVTFSGTWSYMSGENMTLGVSKYILPTEEIAVYDFENDREAPSTFVYINSTAYNYAEKNNYRLPAYHRLDLNVQYTKQKNGNKVVWNFGVYNAYNQQNSYMLYFDLDKNRELKLYKLTLFPIIPSVSYSIFF